MQRSKEERSRWQGICQALTKQAEEYRTSGEGADSTAGIQGSFPSLFAIHVLNEETEKQLLIWSLYVFLACCESHW